MSRTPIFALFITLLLVLARGQDISKHFDGLWDLQVQISSTEDHLTTGEVIKAVANFTRVDGRLFCKINDVAGDMTAELQLEWLTQTSGEVYLLQFNGQMMSDADADGDSDSFEVSGGYQLFAFEFVNKTGSIFAASDKFIGISKGSDPQTYQWILVGGHSFVFNVISGKKVTTVYGSKRVEPYTPGFWSKYGMPIMLIGTMMLSRLLRPQLQQAAQRAQQQQQSTQEGSESSSSGKSKKKTN